MKKPIKLSPLNVEKTQYFIDGLKNSNYERVKVFVNKYVFSQKDLNYLCKNVLIHYNVSLKVIDLLIEKGLKINNKNYFHLGFQSLANSSFYQSHSFIQYNNPHNLDFLQQAIFNEPKMALKLFNYLNEKTNILATEGETLLVLATLHLNLEMIKVVLKSQPSLDINLIKNKYRKYNYPKISTCLYQHSFASLEYLINNYCLHQFDSHISYSKELPSKEAELIDFLDNLKLLGLKFDNSDKKLLIASLNNDTLDLFNYLSKDIQIKTLTTKKTMPFIIESVSNNCVEPFKHLVNTKKIKIKESFLLNLQLEFKLSDYTFLLLHVYNSVAFNNVWPILSQFNYQKQIKKEIQNIILNLAQEDLQVEHAFFTQLKKDNFLKYIKNPEVILKKMSTLTNTNPFHFNLVKEEMEKLVMIKEKKKLEKQFLQDKINMKSKIHKKI